MASPSQHAAPLTFHLVFHTHWDREWYLPRAALTARLVPVVDQLLDALDQDTTFRTFLLDGQTVLLEDYLRIRPDQEARVRALVSSGRLGTGPWYVLADELTPSGEALIRNLLIGGGAARRLGRRLDVLYSPDAFGHPAVLPALAAQFDIRFGVVWRGLAPRRDDGDLFRWVAPDGSGILLYQLPRDGYEIGASLPADVDALREAWPAVREALATRASSRHVAVFVGADHHAHHLRPSMLRDLLAGIEAGNEVRISSVEEFLRAAEAEAPPLRTLRAELRDSRGYTWTLQGVHGTRLPLKRLNARVQLLLERWAEPLAALAHRHGRYDRRPLLAEAWRSTVRSHFHDSIAGCTHDRVAAAARGRLADAAATAQEVVRASIDELTGHDPDAAPSAGDASALVVWNPAARRRGGIAVAEVSFFRRDVLVGPPGARIVRAGKGFAPFDLASADGRSIPVQVIEKRRALERRDAWRHYPDLDEVDAVRIAFQVSPAPGLGLAKLTPVSASPDRVPVGRAVAAGRRLSNGVIEIDVASDGTLGLHDLRSGARFEGLLSLESGPDAGDTYSFEPGAGGIRRSRARVRLRAHATGPLVGVVEGTWEDLEASFRLRVELRSGEPFARIAIDIVNRGRDRRLRARLPLGLRDVPVVAGAAFGSEQRAPGAPAGDSAAEASVPTAPAQRFVAAGGTGGMALLVPGHCEYEWQRGGDLLLTLLRSVGQLSRDDLSARPGHAGWPTPTPEAQCPGADRVTLALAPLSGEPAPDELEALWEEAFLPLSTRWIRDAGPLRVPRDSVELAGDGLILSAVKPAEDGRGIVLRCWNAQDRPVEGSWTVVPAPSHAWRIRADEEPGEPLVIGRAGEIRFSAGAREIVTIRIA